MIHPIRALALCLSVAGLSASLAGCSNDAQSPEAKIAADAVGIDTNDDEVKQTSATTRDVDVIKNTKVVEHGTGKVLSDETQVTPVTLEKETKTRTDVDVNVGETQVTNPKN